MLDSISQEQLDQKPYLTLPKSNSSTAVTTLTGRVESALRIHTCRVFYRMHTLTLHLFSGDHIGLVVNLFQLHASTKVRDVISCFVFPEISSK